MSIDFPRAWQIARETSMEEHHEKCSYRQTNGGLLCDCAVVTKHPEYLDDVLHGVGGKAHPSPGNAVILKIMESFKRKAVEIAAAVADPMDRFVIDCDDNVYEAKTRFFIGKLAPVPEDGYEYTVPRSVVGDHQEAPEALGIYIAEFLFSRIFEEEKS